MQYKVGEIVEFKLAERSRPTTKWVQAEVCGFTQTGRILIKIFDGVDQLPARWVAEKSLRPLEVEPHRDESQLDFRRLID